MSIFSLRTALLTLSLATLAACGNPPPDSAYLNRGGPESLLDVSSETVNLSAASKHELSDLADWIERDQPTRAELNCNPSDKYCEEASKILELQGVPIVDSDRNDHTVTLVYERILARDCNQRYVDNTKNYYNTNHPAFGCSVAANMVQQVSDKQEFVSPNIADDPNAVRAVNDYRRAYVPRPVVLPYSTSQSQTSSASSQ